MKKFLSILLSLTLLLSVVALPIGAVDAAAMYTETSASEVSAGDTFTYTISLSGSYMGYACSIPVIDGLTVETITKSDTDLGKATNVDKKADGSYLLSVLPSFDTTDAEKSLIATVTVKVNDDAPAGTITLSLDKVQVANSVGDKVADLQTHFASISVVEEAHEHSYGAWTKLDDEFHHRTCVCGDEQKEAHKWDDGIVTTPATDTTPGVKTYTCTVCNATKTEEIPVVVPAEGLIVTVGNVKGRANKTIEIPVTLTENPGIWGIDVIISYDRSLMTLTEVKNGEVFLDSELTPGNMESPNYTLSYSSNSFENNTQNGILATLVFTVNAETPDGTYAIKASYINGNIINAEGDDVPATMIDGSVEIISFIYGDLNDDEAINKKDLLVMRKYLAGQSVEINLDAADVNVDGIVNKKDLLLLTRYLAGQDVTLGN